MRFHRTRSVVSFVCALAITSFVASVARGDIVPNSGTLSVSASFDWTTQNQHETDSKSLPLGPVYGTLTTHAQVTAATIDGSTTRTPTSLSFDFTGNCSSGGATITTTIGGGWVQLFTLTAAADLEETGSQIPDPHYTYSTLLINNATNALVNTSGPGLIPAGSYTYRSFNMSAPVGPGFGSGTYDMHRTLAIVPEPACALSLVAVALTALRPRRRANR